MLVKTMRKLLNLPLTTTGQRECLSRNYWSFSMWERRAQKKQRENKKFTLRTHRIGR